MIQPSVVLYEQKLTELTKHKLQNNVVRDFNLKSL